MEHVIIGLGQIGTALQKVLYCDGIDNRANYRASMVWASHPDVIHICFPYLSVDQFTEAVEFYQEHFKPRFTVVHSTVPVGTCHRLLAISSPVRGLHPNLEAGIRTFVKFVGGTVAGAGTMAEEFRRYGLRVLLVDKSETCELAKLLDTEYYRACIEFAHQAKQLATEYDVPFHEAYTLMNQTYNEGYERLGYPEYVRPVLQAIPGAIGGHCVVPNSKLLRP
jgi:UDP-N-acetyl-D-mannosaminuronate dehydrogenase